jgi:hypothetical protein
VSQAPLRAGANAEGEQRDRRTAVREQTSTQK